MSRCIVGALLCLAGWQSAIATPAFSLEDLLERARRESPQLAVIRADEPVAQAGQITARAWPNPEIELLPGRAGAVGAGTVNGYAQRLQLSQPLENPSLRDARRRTADQRLLVSQTGTQAAGIHLDSLVRKRYYDLVRLNEERQAYEEDLQLAQAIATRIEVRTRTGEAPRFDLIRAESEVALARRNLEASRLRGRGAAIELKRVVSPDLPDDFELAPPSRPAVPLDDTSLTALRRQTLDGNADIRLAVAELERARRQLALEQATVLPQVTLRLAQDRAPDMVTHQVGVAVVVPLFNRREGPIGEAQALVEKARLQLEQRRFESVTAFDSAVAAWRAASTEVRAIETEILGRARRAVTIAEAAYRSGERGILDFLDAQRQFRLARNELIQARHGLNLAQTELQRLAAQAPALPGQADLEPTR